MLQNNVELFGQLYMSMQNREGDLAEFFAHEKQSFPTSLSDFGKLHLPDTNSDLFQCLNQPGQSNPPSTYDCKILDGAVIIHCLPFATVSTLHEYADTVFIKTYVPDSLEESTQEKRDKALCRKVSGKTKLRDPTNKAELFSFLTAKIKEFNWPPAKAVYVAFGETVVSVGASTPMQNCDHEKADN